MAIRLGVWMSPLRHVSSSKLHSIYEVKFDVIGTDLSTTSINYVFLCQFVSHCINRLIEAKVGNSLQASSGWKHILSPDLVFQWLKLLSMYVYI